jgi:hypothetical protein
VGVNTLVEERVVKGLQLRRPENPNKRRKPVKSSLIVRMKGSNGSLWKKYGPGIGSVPKTPPKTPGLDMGLE